MPELLCWKFYYLICMFLDVSIYISICYYVNYVSIRFCQYILLLCEFALFSSLARRIYAYVFPRVVSKHVKIISNYSPFENLWNCMHYYKRSFVFICRTFLYSSKTISYGHSVFFLRFISWDSRNEGDKDNDTFLTFHYHITIDHYQSLVFL